jgi:hypothetical protein
MVRGTQLTNPYQAVDFSGGAVGTQYNLPFSPQSVDITKQPTLVLGENGIALAKGSTTVPINGVQTTVDQIASFNIGSGSANWTYHAQPGNTLTILAVLSDGSLAINDSQNGAIQLNMSGIPAQTTGPLGGVPQYSWTERWAVPTSSGASGISLPLEVDSGSAWATPEGNASKNGLSAALCPCLSQTGNDSSSDFSMPDSSANPSELQPAGSATTYLQLIGDPGLNGADCLDGDPTHCHYMGQRFTLAAANDAATLAQSGTVLPAVRVSSVQDVAAALKNNGPITGSVTYYGHGALLPYQGYSLSVLAAGQGQGTDTNVSVLNYQQLSNAQLSNQTSIVLKICHAGLRPPSGGSSIAQLLANQLNRGVYAWKVGFFFSHSPTATSPNGMPSQSQPMYFFPLGGSSIAPCLFQPNQPEPQKCGGGQ